MTDKVLEFLPQKTESKPSTKFQKPHCIIPIQDFQWVMQQTKTIQTLWNECWVNDPFGNRFVPIITSLGERAFRLARQVLSSTGLFQFQRQTSLQDSRKTEVWMVKNLHGARRISEFWTQEKEQVTEEATKKTNVINFPISGTESPISGTESPISGSKPTANISKTPVKASIPEPLNSSSLFSQELLNEVLEKENAALETDERFQACIESNTKKLTGWLDKIRQRNGEKIVQWSERFSRHASGIESDFKEVIQRRMWRLYRWNIPFSLLQELEQLKELGTFAFNRFTSKFDFLYRGSTFKTYGSFTSAFTHTFDQALAYALVT
jgi:hypothetical protein